MGSGAKLGRSLIVGCVVVVVMGDASRIGRRVHVGESKYAAIKAKVHV